MTRSTRLKGETTFRLATAAALAGLVLFLAAIFLSLAFYTNWGTFLTVIASDEVLFAIRLSLVTASLSTLIAMLVAVPSAYAISRFRFPGKDIVDTLLDLPIFVSPIAIGAALLVFFNTPPGTMVEERLMRFVFEIPGIVLAQFTIVSGLAVRLLKSTFDGIDPRYEQVARTLGYSRSATFFKVTLPLARQGLIAACILTWAKAAGEFGATVMLAGATKMKTETLPIAIFLNFSTADIEKAVAVIFVLVAISVGVLFVLRKLTGRAYQI
jgi:molybdate transport system permease protein